MKRERTESILRVIGSGSSGNCLAIYDSRGQYVLVDAGLPYKSILSKVDYDIVSCKSVFYTHGHQDHSKSMDDFIRAGIPCYGNRDLCSSHPGCRLIECGGAVRLDGWRVQTFELVHNVPNNAFIVDTFDGIRILYCTDTRYIPYRVRNVNYAVIECNHDDDYMIDNMMEGRFSASRPEHHQEITDCIDYLRRIYSPCLQCVVLWHMSDSNICEKDAVQRVKDELSFSNVVAASKGLTIELNKEEF